MQELRSRGSGYLILYFVDERNLVKAHRPFRTHDELVNYSARHNFSVAHVKDNDFKTKFEIGMYIPPSSLYNEIRSRMKRR